MDPFSIAALIAAVTGAGSSILGGFQQSANTNATNALNAQMLADQKLGSTDARGNRTRFVEGQGWVTDFGKTDRMLEDYFLNQELPAAQDQYQRADQASRRDYTQSNALLDEFNRIQRMNPADIENLLYSSATRGIGESTNEAMETAMRSVARSGTSHGGKIAEGINKAAALARGNAAVDAKLKSLDYVDNAYNNQRGNVSNLYQAFADQARSSLQPTTSAGSTPTTSVVGSQNYVAPQADMGLANALGGVGSALSGSLNSYGASQQNNDTNALLQAFITGGGQTSLSNGGMFNSIADRTRTRAGAF